jgi:beta-lactamase superfamily II metal-dependent hydrolase
VRSVILDSGAVTGATVHTVRAGDVIEVDEIRFDVIHVPDLAYADKMNMNDSSTVYKMTYDGGQTMMLLGDAEWVTSNDLVENHADLLKSDIVQVGHHGCGNVSKECYEAIGADVYLWQVGNRFWYSENGEGLNTHNTGVIRTRSYMMECGARLENVYRDTYGILTFTLPIEIK